MSAVITFDPFEPLPFSGYIDPESGRQERYISLAQFFHTERLRGTDPQYRQYLLQLNDPEMFRLEVEGVGIIGGVREGWESIQSNVLYAGIYMQAISNRNQYAHFVRNSQQLCVADSSEASEIANALGEFISDISSGGTGLKVAFLGQGSDPDYMRQCFSVVFAKNRPQCLLALENDGCASVLSAYAEGLNAPFALIDGSLEDEAISENLARRCSHVFHFVRANDPPRIANVTRLLESSGFTVRPIHERTS